MRFKVKDLMISTLGKQVCGEASVEGAFNCTPQCSIDLSCIPSNCGATNCGPTNCGACTGGCSGCTSPATWKDGEAGAEDFSTYMASIEAAKSRLKRRIAELEAHQKSIEESLTPATLADVEALEAKLKDALQHLARRKDELKKKKKKKK
jgi:hypothetical protein